MDALNEWQLVLVGAATLAALIGLAVGGLLLLGLIMQGNRPANGETLLGGFVFPGSAVLLVLIAAVSSRVARARRAALKDGVPAFLMAAAGLLATTLVWLVSG